MDFSKMCYSDDLIKARCENWVTSDGTRKGVVIETLDSGARLAGDFFTRWDFSKGVLKDGRAQAAWFEGNDGLSCFLDVIASRFNGTLCICGE